jgi:hypothetical protein
MYNIRSTANHKVQDFPALVTQPPKFEHVRELLSVTQEIVRKVILKASLDADFAAKFSTNESVNSAFVIDQTD